MREEGVHKIEVHVAGICFNDKGEVLIAKRSPERGLYPGLWECGGGQVYSGENFDEAVKRQMKEELGVIAEPLAVVGTYEIFTPHSEQKKIPGLKFACRIKGFINGKEPFLSEEHTKYRWVSTKNLDGIDFIPGVKQNILDAFKLLR